MPAFASSVVRPQSLSLCNIPCNGYSRPALAPVPLPLLNFGVAWLSDGAAVDEHGKVSDLASQWPLANSGVARAASFWPPALSNRLVAFDPVDVADGLALP